MNLAETVERAKGLNKHAVAKLVALFEDTRTRQSGAITARAGAGTSTTAAPNTTTTSSHPPPDSAATAARNQAPRSASTFYMPEIGRFLEVDPARQYVNPYNYVGNNPMMNIDPSGLYDEFFGFQHLEVAADYPMHISVNVNRNRSDPDDRVDVHIYYDPDDYSDLQHVKIRMVQECALQQRDLYKGRVANEKPITAREALIRTTEFAETLGFSGGNLVNTLTFVFTGRKMETGIQVVMDTYNIGWAFNDEGFRPAFQDGENQNQHFLGYLQAAWLYGELIKSHPAYIVDTIPDKRLADAAVVAARTSGLRPMPTIQEDPFIRTPIPLKRQPRLNLSEWMRNNL